MNRFIKCACVMLFLAGMPVFAVLSIAAQADQFLNVAFAAAALLSGAVAIAAGSQS